MASSIRRTNDNWKDKSPTDDELGKLLDKIPVWFRLVVALGVPRAQAEAYRQEHPDSHIAGLHALCYWRDGRCEAKFPSTWKFLLETVDNICGSQVSKKLEAIVSPVQMQLVGPHSGETKNESPPITLRHRIVSAPQSPGRPGGNVPPQTVRRSSHEMSRMIIVVIVLVLFCLVLGVTTYYREPIGDSRRSTYTRVVDIIRDNPIDDKTGITEEPLETSQPQMESETSSAPTLTQSGLPRPSNAPPKEEEERRVAEEQKLKEQREKEEAQRKLEEDRKKPTFKERKITVEVYKSNIHKWELVHSAEAVDVATGISAKAKNYKSKDGAKEHARENLKAILLERGIIRKDDI